MGKWPVRVGADWPVGGSPRRVLQSNGILLVLKTLCRPKGLQRVFFMVALADKVRKSPGNVDIAASLSKNPIGL